MANLLDTHTFIWFVNGDRNLSVKARKQIENNSDKNFVSIATIWEIAIKISLGKLELQVPFAEISNQLDVNGFQVLPISVSDILVLTSLPFHHRDPFDRMLIAQSISNDFKILTKDGSFNAYDVEVYW